MSGASKTTSSHNQSNKPIGIWRDRNLLVVSKGTVQYPKRCVKTNVSEDVSLHTLDVSQIGNARLVTGATVAASVAAAGAGQIGVDGVGAAQNLTGPSTRMPIPFSQKWMQRHKFHKLMSQIAGYGGIAALILSVVGYVFAIGATRGDSLLATLMLGFVGVVFFVMVAGLISLLIVNQPPLRLKKQTEKYVWIKGVCREFLESLPDFAEVQQK